MLYVIVTILTVIVAILLIGIVLIQKSKGGGLSSQFGGANSMMGVRQTNTFLENGTWWLAGIIVLLSICSVYTMPKMGSEVEIRSEAATTAPAPAANQFDTPVAAPATTPAATPEAVPATSAPQPGK